MLDARMEDLVRQALRDDASSLPRTITVDVLERRLAERRRARDNRRWVVVAAATVLAVAGTAGVGSSRVDLQACKLEYSIVSPK